MGIEAVLLIGLQIKELHNRCSEEAGLAVRRPANRVQPTIVTPKKAMESLMLMVLTSEWHWDNFHTAQKL